MLRIRLRFQLFHGESCLLFSSAFETMPAKDSSFDKEKSLELFLSIGLDERTARNTIANNKVTANLVAVVNEVLLFFFFFFFFFSFFELVQIEREEMNFRFWSQILVNLVNFMVYFQANVADGCSRTVGNLLYTVMQFSWFLKFFLMSIF